MEARERRVLAGLQFNAVPTAKTLWSGDLPHVPSLNMEVYDRVRDEIRALKPGVGDSPPGLVIHGEYGSGKSHLVWWARRYVSGTGGYYFNIQPDGRADTLWTRVVSSMLHDLCEPFGSDPKDGSAVTQLSMLIGKISKEIGLSDATRAVLSGKVRTDPEKARLHLADFTDGIRDKHPSPAVRNVALALGLLALRDDDANAAGWSYLHDSDSELDARRAWGLRPVRPGAPDGTVSSLSALLAMAGPSLFVVDQIDDLVVRSTETTENIRLGTEAGSLAAELMEMREKLTRSITLISCLEHTWQTIQRHALTSALDRFKQALELKPVQNPEVGRELITKFLAPQYEQLNFAPPFETWPIPAGAFDRIGDVKPRPRRLIQLVEQYVRSSLEADELLPVTDLFDLAEPESSVAEDPVIDGIHTRYLELRRSVTLDRLKETSAERDLGSALNSAMRALAVEAELGDGYRVRDSSRGAEIASTHCEIMAPSGSTVYLRGINTTRASAVGSRIDNACDVANANPHGESRLLVVATNPWNRTPRISRAIDALDDAGGRVVNLDDDELRTLQAIHLLIGTEHVEGIAPWLKSRRVLSDTVLGTEFLKTLEPVDEPSTVAMPNPEAQEVTTPESRVELPMTGMSEPVVELVPDTPNPVPRSTAVPLGLDHNGDLVDLDLPSLRKHMAIFAGSGSGKTVLIRRVIEECALRGVSTIVLDPNNDLARLGEAPPEPSATWWPGDVERSREYLDNTDVVVWTPGVGKGNPLSLQPFPDFAAVRDDVDELRLAVEATVASLAPRARIDGENHVADGRRAVLRETLSYFARRGGGSFDDLIEMLQDPPEEVLFLPGASKHADFVASGLSYARSNDPLFDGEGTSLDPNRLLTPRHGYRARVSVINLAGIPDENRPAFINRLQMTLFSWIKRHPARDKPLSGLFIMDEAQTFIPSGKATPCTESTRNLASQARKYGLGLVYATQAPRGIDSRITGNAASHVYGRLTVPAHVGTVNEMARARGEAPPQITNLTAGRFFASLEGRPLTEITVPMCLSHHGPPMEEPDIAERARASR